MLVTVQFFAHLGDIAGSRSQQIDIPDRSTPADIERLLARQDGRFERAFAACRIAVNDEWASREVVLRAGDDVSFIPPVSGG